MKALPLAAPKVEQATPSGTIHANPLNTLAPNVVATALKRLLFKTGCMIDHLSAILTLMQAVRLESLQ